MDYVVYDIEIVKGIPKKGETPVEGMQYCKGWGDHANMGISVIGAYDSCEDRYRVFCEDNFAEFLELIDDRDLRVSFNGVGFDDKVINAEIINKRGARDLLAKGDNHHYDILREIWIAAGYNPDRFYWKTHGGFGLDDMGKANGLGRKTGHGALAPVHWQQGKIGDVIDYCLQDVHMTRDLFELCQSSPIKNPKGGTLDLRVVLDDYPEEECDDWV